MNIKNPLFETVIGQMRASTANVPSYMYCGLIRTQSDIAIKLNKYVKKLARQEDNYGLLKAVSEVLDAAKDECWSKNTLLGKVNMDLPLTKRWVKDYSRNIRELKYRRWMVGSSRSLLGQMFASPSPCYDEYRAGGLESPAFSHGRDAWYRLSDNTHVYEVLAKAYARLVRPNDEDSANVICKRSVDSFRANTVILKRCPDESEISCKIRGRAIVSFGISEGGVPLLLSFDCTFGLDGVIDDIPKLGYDIVAFRPNEAIVTRKIHRLKRSEANGLSLTEEE